MIAPLEQANDRAFSRQAAAIRILRADAFHIRKMCITGEQQAQSRESSSFYSLMTSSNAII